MHSVVQKLEVLVMGDVCVQVCSCYSLAYLYLKGRDRSFGGEGCGFH